ncbi:hypothetical protein DFH08DRAFT_917800 [Mycena albidolilacea]|uniref:CxC2-like cysteine cluster KDZ transposase-associated domain-containing protein n=1 Tax=Mycena albidolilacea TaxID=1033008 RepID=A0AAD6ZC39_9AGAR|nr:hypothetical protein DFH08DRAFT_917800 [Mycena albidolilacea]
MALWVTSCRERFLDEMLRLEGRSDQRHQRKCGNCLMDAAEARYRCKDCFSDALFCQACLVVLHKDNPLHRVEMWNDSAFFEVINLKSLGLRIQLGHGRNGTCPGTLAKRARTRPAAALPEAGGPRDDFCIVDSNGVHEVGIDFCSCSLAETHDVQLLRALLRDFHLLSLEAKCSAHHFYNKLARQTNNSGVFQPRTRYNEFRRMTRQWRHLQMLKRAGRGHAAEGITGTKAGECALLCPACPQPGKNLPCDGSWRHVPQERRFLYALFLALDANFRMKRKDVSSEADDPSLGDGIAFFSQVEEYMAHLDKHWDIEQEKSTCVAHDAVDEPDREAHGTAASGIGTVDCARHNMKRPNAVGDLQKGENCCMRGVKRYYVWLIPKFHLPAHIEACNILFSFNLTPYVGQTDGEAPERGWANANPLATSTKEMGPGARRDALDDHFNDWNHKKIVGLGSFLLERGKKAVTNMMTHRLELLEAEQGLPGDVVAAWTTEMELWEADSANPNPFRVADKPEGLFAIRGRLAAEATTAVAGDEADDIRGDLHAHEMINMGLQLEEQQRDLAVDSSTVKLHATDRQKTALLERSNKLGRKIKEWLKIWESFTPVVATLRVEEDAALKLWLPSRLAVMPGASVKRSHARYEFELRVGHAHAALEELRRLLLVRTAKYHYKDAFQHGVAANTRANTAIANVDERIRRAAAQYRVARLALVNLGPLLEERDWKLKLRPLSHDDVRQRPRATFSDPDHKTRKKRKKRDTPAQAAEALRKKREEERPASWIWLAQLSEEEGSQTAMAEALQIEWAKTRARAWRWTEEVDLVEEEMRRVLEFQRWKAGWWIGMDPRPLAADDQALREGCTAYARRQSRMQLDLRRRFEENWKDLPRYIQLGRDSLGSVPPEAAGDSAAGAAGEEQEEDEDADSLVPEVAADARLVASFVEESLA